MKSLNTIQTISKIAKIISKIVFIIGIVGLCICAAGIVFTAVGTPVFKIGGTTIEGLIQNSEKITVGTIYSELSASFVLCVGTVIISRFSANYFERELKDGTPFTCDGANEMQKLGIISICVSLGTYTAANIVHEIIAKALEDVAQLKLDFPNYVTLGITLIIIAQLCKYGAQLREESEKQSSKQNTIEQ